MQPVDMGTSIVLSGLWNPSIFHPNWIAKQIFKRKEEKVNVGMEIPETPGLAMRFTIDDVTIEPSKERIIVYVTNFKETLLEKAENCATNILSALPHTPMRGFGHNFVFEETEPDQDILRIFETSDDILKDSNKTILTNSLVNSIDLRDCVLNFIRMLDINSGKITFKFNFHYQCETCAVASTKISGSIKKNVDEVYKIMKLYGLTIESPDEGQDL